MGRQRFTNVRQPSAVQNEIYRQMEANENRKYDRVGASVRRRQRRGARRDSSIPAQIRELDELRKQGVLTEAEFAGQEAAAARPHVTARRAAGRQPRPVGHRDAAGLGRHARRRAPGSASSPTCPHVGGTKDPDVAAIVALAPTSW